MAPTSSPRAHAAAGSMIQVGARIGVLLLGVVLMGYLARRLGTAEYGRYAVAVVLINWLMFTVVVATGSATIRLVGGQKNGHRYAVSMLQMAGMLATLLAMIIALLAEPLAHLLRSPATTPLLRIFAADFAVGAAARECHSGNRLGEFAAALLFSS